MTETAPATGAADLIVATLRDLILSGDLAPGTRFTEAELCAAHGVARPTVRTAIQVLVHQGLLERSPNRSPSVPQLTQQDVLDLFYVRVPLEVQTVRALVGRVVVIPAAEEATRQMEELPHEAHWSDVVEADRAFHNALVEAVGSKRLSRLYRSLDGEIRLCVAQLRPAWASPAALGREHREVLSAITEGSVDDAVERMRNHLEKAVVHLTGRRPDQS